MNKDNAANIFDLNELVELTQPAEVRELLVSEIRQMVEENNEVTKMSPEHITLSAAIFGLVVELVLHLNGLNEGMPGASVLTATVAGAFAETVAYFNFSKKNSTLVAKKVNILFNRIWNTIPDEDKPVLAK